MNVAKLSKAMLDGCSIWLPWRLLGHKNGRNKRASCSFFFKTLLKYIFVRICKVFTKLFTNVWICKQEKTQLKLCQDNILAAKSPLELFVRLCQEVFDDVGTKNGYNMSTEIKAIAAGKIEFLISLMMLALEKLWFPTFLSNRELQAREPASQTWP